MTRLLATLVVALLLRASTAQGASVVTLCAFDTQPPIAGKGMNLATALGIGGTITFQCGGPATIALRQAYTITRNTIIDGTGGITLDGGNRRMFFGFDDAVTLRLVDLAIVRGGAPTRPVTPPFIALWIPGGVVRGHMRLEIVRTTITRSESPIWMTGGSVRIEASRFSDNSGTVVSAGNLEVLDRTIFSNNRGTPVSGKAGQIVIDRSDFWANSAPSRFTRCVLRVSRSHFSGNTGSGDGGALNIDCDATIEESDFRNNHAQKGGAIHIGSVPRSVSMRAVTFTGNRAVASGGAIDVEPSRSPLDLELRHVAFSDNRARYGGALTLDRSLGNTRALRAVAVTFRLNQAEQRGGAIFAPNASLRISRGIFAENRAPVGAAIAAVQQGPRSTELANSILVRNHGDTGSGFWGSSATFINTTIADNDADAIWPVAPLIVPGGTPAGTPATFPLRFRNTIIASEVGNGCGVGVSLAPFVDGGNNVQHPGTSCGASIPSAAPALGPYYVPLAWSPAINGGSDSVCTSAPISRKDFYNTMRPLATRCSIGAVEGSIAHLITRWRARSDVRYGTSVVRR